MHKKSGFREMKSEHYEHGSDKPHQPKQGGQPENLFGCHDFKNDAADQAYGQGGMSGCKSDQSKIKSQMFSGAFKHDS